MSLLISKADIKLFCEWQVYPLEYKGADGVQLYTYKACQLRRTVAVKVTDFLHTGKMWQQASFQTAAKTCLVCLLYAVGMNM